jgi:hypothetical protein
MLIRLWIDRTLTAAATLALAACSSGGQILIGPPPEPQPDPVAGISNPVVAGLAIAAIILSVVALLRRGK